MNNDIYPLPWVGGKRRFVGRILPHLVPHLRPGRPYLEPFAGGAAVALTLLHRFPWLDVWINDANPDVSAFWKTLQADPDYLIDRMRREHPERGAWHHYRTATPTDPNEQAWRLYALHAWSYSQKGGSFNPGHGARTRLDTKEIQFRTASRLLRDCRITNLDFRAGLNESGVAYCDPPYFIARRGYYAHPFNHLDHLDLARLLLARSDPWLLSYGEHPAVHFRFKHCCIEPVRFARGLGGPKRDYRELLIHR